jgi:hypothetical protein
VALSLEDVLNLPSDIDPERLQRMGLLAPPTPPPSIIPAATGPVAKMSPVSAAPAAQPAAPAAPALQPLAPQVDQNAVKPMNPPNLLNSPQSSLMGYQSRETARRAGEDLNAPAGAGPTLPATESGRDQVELDRLRDEQKHPWGTPENHPGTLGKIGHVLSRIGNIAGDVVAPATMAIIPGTDLNRRVEERGLENRVASTGKEEAAESEAKAREASEEPLRAAQADEASARAESLRNPKAEKPESVQQEYADAVADAQKRGVDPAKDPKVQQLSDAITSLQKEPAAPKENKAVAGTVAGRPAWGVQTEKGWIDPQTQQPIPDFRPAPNYAQVAPATRTTELLGGDNVMHRFQFNEATGKYDIDMGPAPTGTAAHQIFQAGAIERLVPAVIADINANREVLGHLSSYYKSWLAGTPVSDPNAAKMMGELMSLAAMQPALHAFRSRSALESFEKIIGGLAKDPDSTIATIQGMLKTPEAFTAVNPKAAKTPPTNAATAPPKTAEEWLKSKQQPATQP